MSEESLFLAALEKNAPVEREAFLNEACGTDRALRARVQLLLDADARARGILDQPAAVGLDVTGAYAAREEVGSVIAGRYKLLEAIGEGGMGTVWVAEQTEPVRRKVALKLIKAGMDSRSVLARFEAERQALAVMDHPNIAKVLDGGLTETGRPFFVMEYVKGVPITEYCDTARLSIPERLNLFTQVCQAVQHAHHKGIIHRDLKPSNILVAPYDDRPVPKVIDFGLAKAMHQSLTERTLHTAHETVLGTPLYMSPEQAQLNNLDVDTRSDIYSLGVLLYELLTGTTPLEKQRFKQAAWDEVKRIIREEDPPRPSLRLSTANTLPSLAAGRQIEPARLTKLVRGELDWIVMKSLEKDRSRRYETANGFAMDIQRYLSGEPVLAAPPSTRYRLQKFVRKNRASLTTAASIVMLLVAGVTFSSWQAVRATRAEAVARQAEIEARAAQRAEAERAEGERLAKLDAEAKQAEAERQQARAEAGEKLASERLAQVDAEKQIAEQEKGIAKAVLAFLQNKLLRQADVQVQAATLMNSGGTDAVTEIHQNPTVRELLDRAARELTPDRIEASFPNQPRVQAAVLQTVGRTYNAVGARDESIAFLKRSLSLLQERLGMQHADTIAAMEQMAHAYFNLQQWDTAISLYEKIRDVRRASLGPDHPDTISANAYLATAYVYSGIWERGLPLCEENFGRAKTILGPRHGTTFFCWRNLANALGRAGQHDREVLLYQELLSAQTASLGAVHPSTNTTRNNLATAYLSVGKTDLAVSLYEEALKHYQNTFGSDHPTTLHVKSNLATAYRWAKLPDLAAALDEETLRLRQAKLGADDPQTITSLSNLAGAYFAAKKWNLAAPRYEELLELLKTKHGPDHPETITAAANLASCYKFSGKLALAIPMREEVLSRRTALLGRDHPDTLRSLHELGAAYWSAGKVDLAVPLYDELVRLRIAKSGSLDPDSFSAISAAEDFYQNSGKYLNALALFEQIWKTRKQELPEEHKTRIDTQNHLGLNLLLNGQFAEAEPHLLASYEDAVKASAFPKDWRLAYVVRLVGLYAESDKPDEVAKWQAELRKFGDETDAWLSRTGSQMLKASRFRAAERLLRECLALREKLRPDDWQTFETKSLIGGALLGQNNTTDAEPLLLAGYEGMKQRSAEILPASQFRLTDAVARLVQLYETLGDKEKAEKWRNELEARRPSNE